MQMHGGCCRPPLVLLGHAWPQAAAPQHDSCSAHHPPGHVHGRHVEQQAQPIQPERLVPPSLL